MQDQFGFTLLRDQHIPELNTRARLFRHVKTGAELLSLENEDENKVFGITFRTPPPDSTGLPHIMEHSVLCGSQKYPLKEPFIELVKGSLKTFLNAFTFPDKTIYPVASQNLQDFYNLIDVYVDAVFHPLLQPHVLDQEGWHYELDDLNAPLVYKGVVFNEMKGAYSNPDDLLQDEARFSLFPDTPYAFDSGGDPHDIPNLSYSQFKHFHEKYYHPSNARIFFYGDDDPEERLRRMDAYLQDFEAIQVDSAIPLQPKLSSPRRVVEKFDPGEAADLKGMMVMNWLLAETSDPQTTLSLTILAHALIGTPASPLRKAMIDSGLGEDLAGGGMEGAMRQMYFSTGLKGMAVNSDNQLVYENKLENLIVGTLKSLADHGFDPGTIAASMNTIEFILRENNTGAFPRGLNLMLRSLSTWLYDHDPIMPLAFEAPLMAIKESLAAGEEYFERLIRQHFLDNQHRTTLILQPEPGLIQREEEAERQRLSSIRTSMSIDELQTVLEKTRDLKHIQEAQDSAEALAVIPSLELADLDRENKPIPLHVSKLENSQVLYHDLFTNGIVYLDLGFDLHTLPAEFLPYVPLFGRALVEMGTQSEDFVKLSQRIGRESGGIRPTSFVSRVRNNSQSEAWLLLRAKATIDKSLALLAILRDVLLTVRLDDQDRFRQMALEEKAEQEASLVPMGHIVINTRLRSLYDEAGWVEEKMSGVDYLFFLRELVKAIETDWNSVQEKLEGLRGHLLNRNSMLCNVTLDQDNWNTFQPRLADFLADLPILPSKRRQWEFAAGTPNEGLTIPAQVNYVGKGADLYSLGYIPDGSIDVIANYLRTTWLWDQVRVQGGAYGAFFAFNHRSGVLTYISYRDPNLQDTLQAYDRTGDFLRGLALNQDELTKSIIGAIGNMDAYHLPDAKGFLSMQRYLTGDDDEFRQSWREQILSTTIEDFHSFGGTLERVKDEGRVVVLGSQEAIAQTSWLQVKRVL